MPSRRVRSLIALAVAASAFAAPVTASADAAPPNHVVSNYETSSGNVLQRDCGFSHPRPNSSGSSIWLFCDTPIANSGGTVLGFIPGSTAAIGPFTAGQVPTGLSEIPSTGKSIEPLPSNQAPQQFLPTPTGLVMPDGTTACGASGTNAYAATWISGVTREPAAVNSSLLLISFTDVCVTSSTGIVTERFGIAEYNPSTNTLNATTRVFKSSTPGQGLPSQLLLGSPVFSGGNLFLFSSICDSSGFGACASGRIFMARVGGHPSSWRTSSAYRFFDPSATGGFTADPNQAQSIISSASPFAVTVDNFSSVAQNFALIEETSLGGDFRVWHASSPTGTWSQGTPGKVPCSGGSGLNLCRALIGHPELSTSSQLLLSFANPGDNHVWVAANPW
jgi:hypothetical protein